MINTGNNKGSMDFNDPTSRNIKVGSFDTNCFQAEKKLADLEKTHLLLDADLDDAV